VIVTGVVEPWSGGLRFLITLAGGFGVGALVGFVGSRLMRAVDNPQAQVIAAVVRRMAPICWLMCARFRERSPSSWPG
jgi:NhaP-type Na+/H+ or K+/H+ antiporter